jgi:hypothetical protein
VTAGTSDLWGYLRVCPPFRLFAPTRLGRPRLSLATVDEQRGRTRITPLGHYAAHHLRDPHRTRLACIRADHQRDRDLPQAQRFTLAISGRGDSTPPQGRARSTIATACGIRLRCRKVSSLPYAQVGGVTDYAGLCGLLHFNLA